jgi:hypothetical protein
MGGQERFEAKQRNLIVIVIIYLVLIAVEVVGSS